MADRRTDLDIDVNNDVNYGLFMDIPTLSIICPLSMLFTPGCPPPVDTVQYSRLRGAGAGLGHRQVLIEYEMLNNAVNAGLWWT